MSHEDQQDARTPREREADHRARNTLQLISSLILLQGRHSPETASGPALKSLLGRVAAVSAAHRQTLWIGGREQVDLAALVREVAGDLATSAGRDGVSVDLGVESIMAPGHMAGPLALIVRETVNNALTHAFPAGQTGRILVELRRQANGLEFSVDDDGTTPSQPVPAAGFGLTVVRLMAQQVRGKLEMTALHPGFRVAVTVPLPDLTTPPVTL